MILMNTLAISPCFPLHRTLPRKRRGFGLLEVILVFAIVIGAAAVAFIASQNATTAASVDHDRTMVNVVGSTALQMYGANWNGAGSPVQTEFYAAPAQFGPGFCAVDPNTFIPGCYVTLTGEPLRFIELSNTSGGNIVGVGVALAFDDLTQGQCNALLAGGTPLMGAAGAYATSPPTQVLHNQNDVMNFCAANASGGMESSIYIVYTPTGLVPPAPTP